MEREVKTIVRLATLEDLKYIDSLQNKESHAIGFLPKVVHECAITGKKKSIHRWSEVCNDKIWIAEENGGLVGFVLAGFGRHGKVHQICIQEDARLLERGRLLLNEVINHGKKRGRLSFICGCADDLESNIFWLEMGWNKAGQRKGIFYDDRRRSKPSDRKVNIYTKKECDLFCGDIKLKYEILRGWMPDERR